MKEFIIETGMNLRCVTKFTSAGGVSFKPHGELIRCKDCKFYHKTEDDQFCGQGSVFAFDEHYCSIAERKEE